MAMTSTVDNRREPFRSSEATRWKAQPYMTARVSELVQYSE